MKKTNKAQGWGMDLIIAVTIFTFGLVVFFIYSLNAPGEAREKIETLSYEGKILANTILSEGAPEAWNAGSVIKIGILSNDKINETKLQTFYDMTRTSSDYKKTKELFDMTYDYYFYLEENMTTIGADVDGIGKPGFNRKGDYSNVKNLVKATRYTVYNDVPMTIYFYIWE